MLLGNLIWKQEILLKYFFGCVIETWKKWHEPSSLEADKQLNAICSMRLKCRNELPPGCYLCRRLQRNLKVHKLDCETYTLFYIFFNLEGTRVWKKFKFFLTFPSTARRCWIPVRSINFWSGYYFFKKPKINSPPGIPKSAKKTSRSLNFIIRLLYIF